VSDFSVDTRDIVALSNRLTNESRRGATELKRGLSDLRRSARTWAIREVQATLGAKRKSIDSRTKVGPLIGLTFALTGGNDPINMASFDPRQLGRANLGPGTRGYGDGVSFRIFKRTPRQILENAFLARGSNPDKDGRFPMLVYERREKGRAGKKGGKLRVFYGPSVADQHAKPEFVTAAQRFLINTASDLLRERIQRLARRG
jgi:hypothetical protein